MNKLRNPKKRQSTLKRFLKKVKKLKLKDALIILEFLKDVIELLFI